MKQLPCIYCGKLGKTKDHIPPKCLFPHPRPHNLVTVPACEKCNKSFSEDDEYFRNVITLIPHVAEKSGAKKLHPIINRSLTRPEAFHFRASMLKKMKMVPLLTASGIYYGEGLVMEVDFSRIVSVCERVIKGLFYHHLKRPLPNDHAVSVYSTETINRTPEVLNTFLKTVDWVKGQPMYIIGKDDKIFSYSFSTCNEEPNATFWVLGFFHAKPFLVFTLPPEQPSES